MTDCQYKQALKVKSSKKDLTHSAQYDTYVNVAQGNTTPQHSGVEYEYEYDKILFYIYIHLDIDNNFMAEFCIYLSSYM